MRIHIQNDPGDTLFTVTPAQWRDALARAEATGRPEPEAHDVTFGDTEAAFRAAIQEAEVLIVAANLVRGLLPLDAPRLRAIFCTSAGLERMAPFDWLPPGVHLLNNSGTHARKGAEFVLMALLMLSNRMPDFAASQQARRWQKHYARVLAGRPVLVAGLGAIGGTAAELAAGMGMVVTGLRTRAAPHPHCTRVVTPADLDSVLPETEFLALTMPHTPDTRGLFDRRRLSLLPRGAAVVNIGRGAVLDQDALCDLLDAEHLSGAVLDVFVPEPVPPEHRLWTTRNLVMTPHVSCDDPATYNPNSLDLFLLNLGALREGRALPNEYDVRRGY